MSRKTIDRIYTNDKIVAFRQNLEYLENLYLPQ